MAAAFRTCCTLLLCAVPVSAAAPPTYWQDVRPVLRKHCLACHNARSRGDVEVSGGLALDSYEAALRAPRKPVVVPGKPGDSLLLQLVTTTDTERRMPLGRPPLPAEAVDLLRRWIDAGAPEGTRAEVDEPAAPRRPRRYTEVAIPTPVVPPPQAFPGVTPAPLTLSLKIGPLAPATAVAFSSDGTLLACGGHGLVALWDLRLGQVVRSQTGLPGTVMAMRFSPDGRLLAVAGGRPAVRGDLRLLRVTDFRTTEVLAGHEDAVAAVAFSPDGRHLASAGFDRTIRIWDLETTKCERVLSCHADTVAALAFGPGGRWLASAGKDCTVRLTDPSTGKTLFSLAALDELRALATGPDGRWVAAAGAETTLYYWDPQTGKRIRVRGGHHAAVNDLGYDASGILLVSGGADSTLRFWDPATGGERQSLVLPSPVFAVAASPDGKRAAAACFDGRVRVYEVGSGKPLLTLLAVPAPEGARWLAQTPQGYLAGSPKLLIDGRWAMGGHEVPARAVWRAVFNPAAVARGARGEPSPPPAFR
jgi:hypothetical protein